MRLTIVAATQFEKAAYQIKQPMPNVEKVQIGSQEIYRQNGTIPNTLIASILVVGDNVEIFWRRTDDTGRGFHTTLCKPTVSILTSVASQHEWGEALKELEARESLEEVRDINDDVWRLNQDVPGHTDFIIVRMGSLGDSVEIFATPKPGTAFDKAARFLHFQLMPFFVQQIEASALMSNWIELQADMREAMFEEYSNDDPDEPDDEPDDLNEPVARTIQAPPPPPPPNGVTPTE